MNDQGFIDHLNKHIKKRSGKPSDLSIRAYVCAGKDFERFLNGREITTETVNEFVKHVQDTHENNGQQTKLCGLRHYLRYIGWNKEQSIELVPIPIPIETKTEADILTTEDIQALLNATKDDILTNRIMKCLYYSALRRQELLNLNIDDVRMKECIVIVRNGKGMKGQPEVITPKQPFFDAVREYLKVRPTPKAGHEQALFIQPKNLTRLTTDSIRRFILNAQRKAGIRPDLIITPHIFRASVLTHMSNHGADIDKLKQLSRHKSIKVLMGYIRPTVEEKRANVERYVPTIGETKVEAPKTPQEPPQGVSIKTLEPVTIPVQVPQQGFFDLLKQGLITPQQYRELMTNSTPTPQKVHPKFDMNYG